MVILNQDEVKAIRKCLTIRVLHDPAIPGILDKLTDMVRDNLQEGEDFFKYWDKHLRIEIWNEK
jgi:hypothetical protein